MAPFCIYEDLKKDFDAVCNELGLNMSTAIMIFAKKNEPRASESF